MENHVVLRAEEIRKIDDYQSQHKRRGYRWSNAMLRSLSGELGQKKQSHQLKPYHLETILEIQGHCCPISGERFVLPHDKEIRKNAGYTAWLDDVDAITKNRIPILVRASRQYIWEAGNVLLISWLWLRVYDSCDTMDEFCKTLRACTTACEEGMLWPNKETVINRARLNGYIDE